MVKKKGVKDNSKWFWLAVGIIIGLILGLLLANLFDARQIGLGPSSRCIYSCYLGDVIYSCIYYDDDGNPIGTGNGRVDCQIGCEEGRTGNIHCIKLLS